MTVMCLVSPDGDYRCAIALAQHLQQIYLCDLRNSGLEKPVDLSASCRAVEASCS